MDNTPKQQVLNDEINLWWDELDLAQKYKEKYGGSKSWDTYKNYYRGQFSGYSDIGRGKYGSILPYNITYAMARTLIPNLYFRNPYVNVTPRQKFGNSINLDITAKIVESMDNWLLQMMGTKQEMKSGLLGGFFTNKAIWKIGYDSQFGFRTKDTEPMLSNTATATQWNKKGERLEYNVNVKPGMPWVLSIPAEDFFVPFGVKKMDDAWWCAHRVIRQLKDVKGDPKYKNTTGLEGTHLERIYNELQKADFYKDLAKICDWVEIYEIRNRKTKEVLAIVPGFNQYIRPPEDDVLQFDSLPFVDISFNEDPDYFWGPSDVKIMEPQQLEMNEAITQAMNHRRVALVKMLIDRNMIDASELDKMMSENVMPAIRVKGNPATVASMLQPHIPPELNIWVDKIRENVRELIGFSRQDMGELPSGRRTASEVRVSQAGKNMRIDERRDTVADALVDIVRKVNMVVFDRWDSERVIQVVGYDAAKYWVRFNKSEIMGDYLYKVDVESMAPTNKEVKRKEIIELIGVLAKYPRANLDYMIKMLMREFEYVDMMQLFPNAPESNASQPMTTQQFTQQQQGLLNNPVQLGARVKDNQMAIGGMMG